jgi:hypothetical protein
MPRRFRHSRARRAGRPRVSVDDAEGTRPDAGLASVTQDVA